MVGRGGGDRTIKPDANAQVIHSTYRSNRKNRQNRMSRYTAGTRSGGRAHYGYSMGTKYKDRKHPSLGRGFLCFCFGRFVREYATECATARKPPRASSNVVGFGGGHKIGHIRAC